MIAETIKKIENNVFQLIQEIFPIHFYIIFSDTNEFIVDNGSISNTKYKEKIPIELVTDIDGFCQSCFIDGYFSICIIINKDSYPKDYELQGTISHECYHAISDTYIRIEHSAKGGELEAYLIGYLVTSINFILKNIYDTSVEDK